MATGLTTAPATPISPNTTAESVHGKKHRLIPALIISIVWLLYAVLVLSAARYGNMGGADFNVYYRATQVFAAGGTPYLTVNDQTYSYPPLLALLLLPLVQTFSMQDALSGFILINLFLIAVTLGGISRVVKGFTLILLWLIPLLFLPLFEALYIGQITVVLAVLFTGIWWNYRAGRAVLVSILLATAIWLKIYPVFFVLLFFLRWTTFDRRVLLYTLVAGLMLSIVQVAWVGGQMMLNAVTFITSLAQYGQPHMVSSDIGVQGFTAQVFLQNDMTTPILVSPIIRTLVRVTLIGLLVGAFAWGVRRNRNLSSSSSFKPTVSHNVRALHAFDLQFAAAILVMLLISPTLFHAGLPPLLLVLFLILKQVPRNLSMQKIVCYGVAAVFSMVNIHYLYVLGYNPQQPVSGVITSFGFYTLLALAAGILYTLFRLPNDQRLLKPHRLLASSTS